MIPSAELSESILEIAIVLSCSIALYASWRLQSRDRFDRAVLLLVACGLILRIYVSSDLYLHEWDERFHALVAKNLISHPLLPTLYDNPILSYDIGDWTANHVWLHKQPLPLWSMASSMWLFGVNELALRLPSILLTTVGIWLTYRIGSYFFSQRAGYFAAFLYCISGSVIEMTGGRVATDHVDVFFLFFIELAVFFSIEFAETRKAAFNVLAGMSIGAAILSKWLPALIVLPIWLLIVADSGKFKSRSVLLHLIVLCVVTTAVFLPWQLYIADAFATEAGVEAQYRMRHLTETLEGRGGSAFFFLDKMRINFGELIYLPLLWLLWRVARDLKDRKQWAIAIWIVVPLVFFSCVQTKMQGYILFICPALFIVSAAFWFELLGQARVRRSKWISVAIMVVMIALPARRSIERMKMFYGLDRNPAWVSDLRKLGQERDSPGVLFNYSRPIEAMFYTDLSAYPHIPQPDVLRRLVSEGTMVIVNDDGTIPDDVRAIAGVSFETLITPPPLKWVPPPRGADGARDDRVVRDSTLTSARSLAFGLSRPPLEQ